MRSAHRARTMKYRLHTSAIFATGLIIHQNDPSHPESVPAQTNPQLAIDYVSVGEPTADSLLFKMKVTNLSTVPPASRWRIVWDSFASPGQQYFVGMRSDATGAVTFDYGTIATAVVGLVVGVPQETRVGPAAGNFNADGTITLLVPKANVGNPQPGDLLGAMNGRTFTGDTPATQDLERSTTLVDHTFVKAQTDNAFPTATYMVAGNAACGSSIVPISAVSRKTMARPAYSTFPCRLQARPESNAARAALPAITRWWLLLRIRSLSAQSRRISEWYRALPLAEIP